MTSDDNSTPPLWATINDDVFKRRVFASGIYKSRYILIAGGLNQHDVELNSIVLFDAYTQTFLGYLPSLPFAGKCVGALLKDYFYVSQYKSNRLYRICLSSERSSWKHIASTTATTLAAQGIIASEDHLYVIGYGGMYRHDPVTEKNELMPRVPTPRERFASAIVGNQLFVMGGSFKSNILFIVEVFDIDTQIWFHGPSLPERLESAAATVFQRRWIILTGGCSSEWDYNTETIIYDTIQQQWIMQSPRNISNSNISSFVQLSRENHQCIATDYHIISIGGWDEQCTYCPMQIKHIKYIFPYRRWELMKHLLLLRKLVDNGDAYPIVVHSKRDLVIQKLFTDVSLDLFRDILTYLFE